MIFNPLKCYVLKITKKKKTVDFDYNINGQTLETVASNPYLGAELTNTMTWDKQVHKVVAKGNKYPVQSYVITFVIDIATGRWFSQCTPISSAN
jgi:hypothetical protein